MLPAGKYYIGNLFNVLTEDDLGQIRDDGENVLDGNRKIAVYTNFQQDYSFWDLQGRNYIMNFDTHLGCIKVDDIQKSDADLNKGQVIEFDEDFETEINSSDICFGRVVIETNDGEHYYDNYEEDEIIEDNDDDYYDDEDEEDEDE